MKVIGIIAEYNPFHNGHAFQIAEIRRKTGADYILAVMSGDFVQRGAPALRSSPAQTSFWSFRLSGPHPLRKALPWPA